jgi:hypothetical protein
MVIGRFASGRRVTVSPYPAIAGIENKQQFEAFRVTHFSAQFEGPMASDHPKG